eukprot:2678474-Rhodomonas_salina.1
MSAAPLYCARESIGSVRYRPTGRCLYQAVSSVEQFEAEGHHAVTVGSRYPSSYPRPTEPPEAGCPGGYLGALFRYAFGPLRTDIKGTAVLTQNVP